MYRTLLSLFYIYFDDFKYQNISLYTIEVLFLIACFSENKTYHLHI